MPTPVGHALGGLAVGWLIAPNPPLAAGRSASRSVSRSVPFWAQLRANWRRATLFAALGALPDLDLLFHVHSTYTHSLGAALCVLLVAWPFVASTGRGGGRMALACGGAYASHVLLDWLGVDNSPPYGITALWPFSSAYYYSAIDLFPAVDRRYWLPGFLRHDLEALAWELLILVPITLAVLWLRRGRGRGSVPQT